MCWCLLKFNINTCSYFCATRDSISQTSKISSIDWKAPYTQSKIQMCRIGNIVICNGNVKFSQSGTCNYNVVDEIIPLGYRPTRDNTSIIFSMNGCFALLIDAGNSGKVKALGDPNNQYACCNGAWYTADAFPE